MPDVSIVIVNYNTCEKLRACLESILREGDPFDVQTIVVDNGSQDGSRDMVREYAPDVTLIAPERNTWFTGGNNLGVQHATADVVWILNPDTILQPDTLQTMLHYLRDPAHSHVGAVTCRMEFPDGGLQRTCSRLPQYIDMLLGYTFLGVLLAPWRDARRQRMWYADWQRDSTRPVEVAPGSNIMARREVLARVDTFDTALKLYFPEDDMCTRIRQQGDEIHFVGGTTLLHHEHASTEQVQRLATRIYFDDLLTFCRKHYGSLRTMLLHALLIPTRGAMDIVQRLRGEKDRL